MANSISFGSTYKAYITKSDIQQGKYCHHQLTQYLDDKSIEYQQTFIDPKRTPTYSNPFKIDKSSQYIPTINDYAVSMYTIVAPDEFDCDIETICANRGIKFEKLNTSDITSESSILNRIKPAQKGYILATINSHKLEKLIENQDSNFKHCKVDYEKYYKEQSKFAIKSGGEIIPQTLYIRYLCNDSTPDSLKEYVNTYGARNLNHNSIAIWLDRDSDIDTYHGLKDFGLKNIPVYLDENSYKNALTLGLLN